MGRRLIERDGAQVWIEDGTGVVTKLEESAGKRNARIEIKATHSPDVKLPIGAWVDTHREATMALLRQAQAEGREVAYVVEVHRKRGISPGIPLDKLNSTDKVRDLVSATFARADQEAPATEAVQRAAQKPPEKPQERQRQAPSSEQPPEPPARSTGPRMVEEKPWVIHNSDGSPNLGSYAVMAGSGMVEAAIELIIEARREPKAGLVEFLARRLMEAADEIQAGVRTDGHSDRMDSSHTRARGHLRSALRFVRAPIGAIADDGSVTAENAEAVHGWYSRVVAAGIKLFRLAVDVAGVEWRDHSQSGQPDLRDSTAEDRRVAAEWPSPEEFERAHDTFRTMVAGLDRDIRAALKAWKEAQRIGWPMVPHEMAAVMDRAQELIQAAVAEPAPTDPEEPF